MENEDVRSWSQKIILSIMMLSPSFLISDMDKGLMKAMRTTVPDILPFFCFGHVMRNFKRKYQSKVLNNFAVKLVRSRLELKYEKMAA